MTPPRRWALCAILALGLALHAPCLAWGFYADDFGMLAVLSGAARDGPMQPWSLYDFGLAPRPGDAAYELGAFPFWCDPDWKGRFFRPLTSLELWGEFVLFGDHATLCHATGLAWLTLLAWLVHALYRAYGLAPRTALLALALFLAHGSSMIPLAWIANRNSLLAVTALVAAMLVLRRGHIAAALGLGLLACLAKESGIATFALIALALAVPRLRPPGTLARRAWIGIAQSLAIAAVYLVSLLAAGYGTRTLFYPTPWGQPSLWLDRALDHLAADLLYLIAPVPPDIVFVLPESRLVLLGVTLLVVLPVAWLVWRRARLAPAAPLFAAWIAVTIAPQTIAPASGRLLFAASIGSSALLALFLDRVLLARTAHVPGAPRRSLAAKRNAGARAVAIALLVLALPLSALGLIGSATSFRSACELATRVVVEAEVGPASLGRREALVLNAPTALAMLQPLPVWRHVAGDPTVRFWPLQAGRRALRLTRVDARTIELESLDEPFLTGPVERVFLTSPIAGRERVAYRTALFEIDGLPEGGELRRFRLRCNEPLDTPHLRFLAWRDDRLRPVALPAIGAAIEIARAASPLGFVP